VDRKCLFDLPPGVNVAAIRHGISLDEVRHLFITHSHQDHLDPCVLAAKGRVNGPPLHIYCNRRVAELLPIYQQFNRFFDIQRLSLDIHTIEPLESRKSEDETFTITALAADHDTTGGEEPLIFILEASDKTLLYACDTGWFPEDSWRAIRTHQFDAVVLDCTFHGLRECRSGHLSTGPFLAVKSLFEQDGLLKPGSRFIAQHIAHLHRGDDPSDEELAVSFAGHGVDVAHDGMVLTI
jgi:phosphoribosyl 1,2-cyclic phosphate phosphodiesterase